MANKANLANSVLFAPLSDSATSLNVYTGDGALFPAAPFYLTLSPKNKWSRKSNSEIVLVTAKSTDTFTITRAQKGTTAKAFDYGDLLAIGIYTEDFDDLKLATMQAMMPVGFVVTLGVSTNPATLYGFGTWTQIQGRVVVGVSNTDGDFDLNDIGGAKTHTLSKAEIPNLYGYMSFHSDEGGSIVRSVGGDFTGSYMGQYRPPAGALGGASSVSAASNSWQLNVGGGGAHNNMQPFIAKYVWERVA